MAEGLAVVGIVSSIVQLVDFASKVLARLQSFQSGTTETPQAFGHFKAELPVLVQVLHNIETSINKGHFPPKSAVAIAPAVQGCQQCILKLDAILEKTLPKQTDSRTKKVLKSIGSVFKDEKIDGIRQSLHGYVWTLTFYFAASSSSTLQQLSGTTLHRNLSQLLIAFQARSWRKSNDGYLRPILHSTTTKR